VTSTDLPLGPASVDENEEASPSALWQRLEAVLRRGSDRLNPILVKEARQALKSRQFSITFTLLLVFGWCWSILGVALLSPGVYFAPGGTFMLVGYFLILAAPILIVVPFSAFRSLAGEREDGTFELLSITSLSSRQIVTGKLGSAVLQMLVYYSALAPCIVFTYLLRGVDIFTILFVLTATFLAAVLLSAFGLLVATVSSARQWQVVLSVILLVALLGATGIWLMAMIQLIGAVGQVPYDDPTFWVSALGVLSFYASFVLLFLQTSAAQLSFASDNRSTKLRGLLMVQQVLWLGWMSYVWLQTESDDILFVIVTIAGIYWFLLGSLLSGELARLSPRVKRSLPQSFLGRTAFTWFNPGSGTGYTFAVVNLLAVVLCAAILALVGQAVTFRGAPNDLDWLLYAGLVVGYVTIYLGVGRLVLLGLRRAVPAGLLMSTLVCALVALLGAAVPLLMQAWLAGYRNLNYGTLQASNWAWTLAEASQGDIWAHAAVPVLVFATAIAVFLLNLVFTITEVQQVRQESPERVLEDDN
jgi:hypothetical protein